MSGSSEMVTFCATDFGCMSLDGEGRFVMLYHRFIMPGGYWLHVPLREFQDYDAYHGFIKPGGFGWIYRGGGDRFIFRFLFQSCSRSRE